MAWNEPGNNGSQDNDPWGNKRGGRNQGPPDLDELFSKFSRKLGGLFGGSGKGPQLAAPGIGLGVAAALGAVIWAASGFYTVGEAERGVVLRFGKYNRVVQPGLNWKPTFVDDVIRVDVQTIRSLRSAGQMLTRDENVVRVAMDVQYRVFDPAKYLYSVINADDSLLQATDSALRAVIGDGVMDEVLTTGRQVIRQRTETEINRIIDRYNMGLIVVDVNFDTARPPEQVKDAFDDAIAAREDEERFIRESEAYRNGILPQATGRAERIKKEALGYKEKTINEALGEVAQFEQLLPEYRLAPEVTRNRLYIETMEKVFSSSSKVLIDSSANNNNLLYLPIDKLIGQPSASSQKQNRAVTYDGSSEELTLPLPEQPISTQQSTSSRQGRY